MLEATLCRRAVALVVGLLLAAAAIVVVALTLLLLRRILSLWRISGLLTVSLLRRRIALAGCRRTVLVLLVAVVLLLAVLVIWVRHGLRVAVVQLRSRVDDGRVAVRGKRRNDAS